MMFSSKAPQPVHASKPSLLSRVFSRHWPQRSPASNIRLDNISINTFQPNLQGLQLNIVKVNNGHLITVCYPYADDPWGNTTKGPQPPDVLIVKDGDNLIDALTAALVTAKLK